MSFHIRKVFILLFSVTKNAEKTAKSAVESDCTSDYLEIMGGTTNALAMAGLPAVGGNAAGANAINPGLTQSRFCGRYLIPTTDTDGNAANTVVSVCCKY